MYLLKNIRVWSKEELFHYLALEYFLFENLTVVWSSGCANINIYLQYSSII